jgi:hypothetical protein
LADDILLRFGVLFPYLELTLLLRTRLRAETNFIDRTRFQSMPSSDQRTSPLIKNSLKVTRLDMRFNVPPASSSSTVEKLEIGRSMIL